MVAILAAGSRVPSLPETPPRRRNSRNAQPPVSRRCGHRGRGTPAVGPDSTRNTTLTTGGVSRSQNQAHRVARHGSGPETSTPRPATVSRNAANATGPGTCHPSTGPPLDSRWSRVTCSPGCSAESRLAGDVRTTGAPRPAVSPGDTRPRTWTTSAVYLGGRLRRGSRPRRSPLPVRAARRTPAPARPLRRPPASTSSADEVRSPPRATTSSQPKTSVVRRRSQRRSESGRPGRRSTPRVEVTGSPVLLSRTAPASECARVGGASATTRGSPREKWSVVRAPPWLTHRPPRLRPSGRRASGWRRRARTEGRRPSSSRGSLPRRSSGSTVPTYRSISARCSAVLPYGWSSVRSRARPAPGIGALSRTTCSNRS